MNIVVADACPVIFLAKLNRLALIPVVLPGKVVLPASVQRELTVEIIPPDERLRIRAFLTQCHVEPVRSSRFPASGLSLADRHVLTLAGKYPNPIVLTDDNLVRRIAVAEGCRVAGTLGIVVRAVRTKAMTQAEGLSALDELVTLHRLRVSVDIYREALRQIQEQ